MHLLLNVALMSLALQPSNLPDTTQIALLRYQLRDQLQKEALQRHNEIRSELDSFKREISQQMSQNIQNAEQQLRSSINPYIAIGGALVVILTIVGYGTIRSFIRRSTTKFDRAIDHAIYRIDPHDMPIKLPTVGMEKQFARLQRLEFSKLSTYEWLNDNCTRYAVVVLATEERKAEELKEFILNKGLEES